MRLLKLTTALIITALFLNGCKKESYFIDDIKYSGPIMVNLNNYDGYVKYDLNIEDKWIDQEFEVKITNTMGTAKEPIKVVLQQDNNPVTEYNTVHGASLTPLANNLYKFEQTEVTIPAGQRSAKFKYQVNIGKFSLGLSNAMGLSIKSVSGAGAVVNTDDNQTRLVVEYGTKNKWDGVYTMYSGFARADNPDLVGVEFAASKDFQYYYLATTGSNSVDALINLSTGLFPTQIVYSLSGGNYTYFTGVNPRINVSASNVVTVSHALATSTLLEQNTAELAASKYYETGIPGVPKTANKKTIVMHYHWNAGTATSRNAKDTFVYQFPR
jgi:hypothetical protein